MNNINLGKYIPIESYVHKLDARTKILISIWLIVILFLMHSYLSFVVAFFALVLMIYFSDLSIKFFIKGIKPLVWLILLTAIFQLLFTTGGVVYWHWLFLNITSNGVHYSIVIFLRFFLIVSYASLLTMTTSPLMISDGLGSLLKPLKYLHLPIDQFTLMLSIALRFIPTLLDETIIIMDSQRSRGVDFNDGGLFKRMKTFIPILIPLFINTINKANDLSIAMEARGYDDQIDRTHYRQLKFSKLDLIALLFILIISVLELRLPII